MRSRGSEERAPSQAAVWADQVLYSDLARSAAVGIGIWVLAALVLESPEPGTVGAIPLGMVTAVIMALIAVLPGRRMPDWAVGLGGNGPASNPASAPLPLLGWVLATVAGTIALVSAGPLEALFALAVALTIPAGLTISLERFLRGAQVTRAWTVERGLDWEPEGTAPTATPLLREGDQTHAINVCSGEIAPGLSGSVMHLLSVVSDGSPDGSSHTTRRFTAAVASVPDPGKRLPLCICTPRSRVPGYDGLDAALKRMRRIDLASTQFERRYELAIDKNGDEVWLRRLFEPTFIERLVLADGGRLGWEIERGTLTAYRVGHAMSAAELDSVTELAGIVAARVRDEVEQTGGTGPRSG